jgi:hypothetical protein
MFERQIGYTSLDVRNFGALCNGVQNDTYAIQCALRALPSDGGTVVIPGPCVVDPLVGVEMRDRTALKWVEEGAFIAMGNDAERDNMIMARGVSHVEFINPVLIGNREDGLGTSGEWGHGLSIRGAKHVTIRGGHVSKCWGDGVSIGGNGRAPAEDIVICEGLVCNGNRRQGLTIGNSIGVVVMDSTFSNTFGTDPSAGIDIEPDAFGVAKGWRLERLKIFGNESAGILVWKRNEEGIVIDDGVIDDCDITSNAQAVWTFGATRLKILNSRMRENRSHALLLDRGTDAVEIRGNRMGYNYTKMDVPARAEASYAGQPKKQQDVFVRLATGLNFGVNIYEAQVFRDSSVPAPVATA